MGVSALYLFDHDIPNMTMDERADELIRRYKAAGRNLIRVDDFDDNNFSDYMMTVSEGAIYIRKHFKSTKFIPNITIYIDVMETYVNVSGFPYVPAYASMYAFLDEFFIKHTRESLLVLKNAIAHFEKEIIPFFHSKLLFIVGDSAGWDLTWDGLYEGKTIEECIVTSPAKMDIYSIDDTRPFDRSLVNYFDPYNSTWPVILHYFDKND